MAASTFFEFAYLTMSFRVCKFVARFLPGIPVWSLLMREGKIFPSLRARVLVIILTSTLKNLHPSAGFQPGKVTHSDRTSLM